MSVTAFPSERKGFLSLPAENRLRGRGGLFRVLDSQRRQSRLAPYEACGFGRCFRIASGQTQQDASALKTGL
jgi:hypothetical protein